MAPEIHSGLPYDGKSVDLFAAAIILFSMLAQRPPFQSANKKNVHYKLLGTENEDLFWSLHA